MSQRFTWGWMQVLVAFLIQSVSSGALMYSYSVIAVPFNDTFQPSRMVLMLGIPAMMLVSGLVSPFLGASIDKKPLRGLLTFALAATAGGFVLLSMVTAMWQVPVIYAALMAFGLSLLGPLSASTLVSRWFLRRRGMALGIAAMGTSFGGFLYPQLIQAVSDALEWRSALRVMGLTIGLLIIPVWLLTVDHPRKKGLDPDGKPLLATAGDMPQGEYNSTGAVIRVPAFWAIALIVGVMFAAFTAVLGNLSPFVLDSGLSAEQGARMIAMIALMAIPGTLLFGWLADRLDTRAAMALVVASIALGLLCYIGASYFWIMAGSVLIGLGGGGMIPIWSAQLANAFGPWSYGRVMGLMNPVLMPFNLAAAPLAGRVMDTTGSYTLAFVLLAGLMLASLLLLPLTAHSKTPAAEPA